LPTTGQRKRPLRTVSSINRLITQTNIRRADRRPAQPQWAMDISPHNSLNYFQNDLLLYCI